MQFYCAISIFSQLLSFFYIFIVDFILQLFLLFLLLKLISIWLDFVCPSSSFVPIKNNNRINFNPIKRKLNELGKIIKSAWNRCFIAKLSQFFYYYSLSTRNSDSHSWCDLPVTYGTVLNIIKRQQARDHNKFISLCSLYCYFFHPPQPEPSQRERGRVGLGVRRNWNVEISSDDANKIWNWKLFSQIWFFNFKHKNSYFIIANSCLMRVCLVLDREKREILHWLPD